MNNLQTVPEKQRDLITFRPADIDLIKSTVAKGATDAELDLFLYQCRKTGLDPLAKQIYFRKHRNRKTGVDEMTIITGIDGYRLVADRTGKYAGNDDPVYDNEKSPAKATVTVYKVVGGIRCPYTASARWTQYYPGDSQGFMWNKMPHLMLGKCAEALALRKAFPAELSGMYVKEEMDQADRDQPVTKAATIEASLRAPPMRAQPEIFHMLDPEHEKRFSKRMTESFPTVLDEHIWLQIAEKLDGKPWDQLALAVDEVCG